ncbi:CGG triplet repeat-binding protein 1 [Caligus rogercresseyi]|uniref:CGG triplet repeat-binding protein 1 n=1 Tax=Caligus rogercresseyi TaxID=217165 RepID=A0A7T8HKX5_CALRO|nr:CGG triplet repeat-binding protein 1 [Caligus rogercresseyi]
MWRSHDYNPLGPLDGRFKDCPFLLDLLDIHAANNKNIQQAVTWALFKVLVKILTTTVYTCSSLMSNLLSEGQVRFEITLTQHDACHRHLSRSQQEGVVKALRRKKALATSGQVRNWFEAAFYYCNHFKGIGDFIESLNDDSLAIVKANKLFKDPKLPGQLAFIKGNFTQLVRAISSL